MNKPMSKHHGAAAAIWVIYLLLCLWLALSLAWWLNASAGYGYSFWYDRLAIGEHIQRYAPEHPYKRGFAQLPKAQHVLAFEQIAAAVHDHGRGLGAIQYPGGGGRPVRLLDRAERTHLEDVAALLDLGRKVSLLVTLCWLPVAWLLVRLPAASFHARAGAMSVLATLLVAPLLLWGPKAVFYQWHIWLFPSGNQWFFYWEDSLMSTLMKAPDLFAGIAVAIAVPALCLTPLLYHSGVRLAALIKPGRLREPS